METFSSAYRGRLAPSPTGHLHLGHARTFWMAQERVRAHNGTLILRVEDLDPNRCQEMFTESMIEDMKWLGLAWQEGPDVGGPAAPYRQSQSSPYYQEAFRALRAKGLLYPCYCSRRDIRQALSAPHLGDEEPIYPGLCRPRDKPAPFADDWKDPSPNARPPSWRFWVPEDRTVTFVDQNLGEKTYMAGRDFGDFVVWRHDDVPAYQLAVVVDDARMRITEVVRGEDLLISAARQALLYEALNWPAPEFYHCPLVLDDQGQRLAKRHHALSLRELRRQGATPDTIRRLWDPCDPAGPHQKRI